MMKLPRLQNLLARPLSRPMSRDKADMLLLLLACTLVLAPHGNHLPLGTSFGCAALLAWRGWITFRGDRLPPPWLLLPITAVAMAGVYWSYHTFFGRDSGVAMLVLLLVFKMLEMHAKRDFFVVMFLSFFLILAKFFYSQSIATAVMMIIAVIALLTTQLSFQYTGAVPPLLRRVRLSAMIFALAVPLTLILFVLFPRVQGPLWGMPGDASAGRTGMSDTMAPGNISSLALSDDIAFRVKFIDPPPSQSRLYWRGVVLGHYDGRTWTQLRSSADAGSAIAIQARGTPIRHQVTLEASGQRRLFSLELPRTTPQLMDNPVFLSPDLQLVTARPITDRVRYDVLSYIDFDLQPNASPLALRPWLQLPPDYNPATLEFAARLRGEFHDNVQLIAAVLKFLHDEKFRYTLDPPLLGRNAVDEFLFSTRAGFCEHYSSAFVVLMRALHIPARVVTGYQGGDINTVDGFMTIRQSDAHAWAEVWLENRGWIRIDPTAAVSPERIEKNLGSAIPHGFMGGMINLGKDSWLSKFRLNWDAVNNAWNQWVLNYTPYRQKSLMRLLGFDDADWHILVALMFGIGILVMAVIAYPLLRNRQRIDPVRAVYAAFCQQMARHGLPRAIHEGPHAYGGRLTSAHSPLAPEKKKAAARFLTLYATVQYGRVKSAPSAALSQLKSLLIECR